jgi:hypothetical protein
MATMPERKDVENHRRSWDVAPAQKELDLALGFMIRQAAMTEFFLHQAVRHLVGGRYASLVTAGMQATSVLDAIKRIADTGTLSSEATREITEISGKLRRAFQERNKYVHGLRVIGDESSQVWTNNRRNGGIDQHPMEADTLMELGADFSALCGAVMQWQRHHLEGKPRRQGGIPQQTTPDPH